MQNASRRRTARLQKCWEVNSFVSISTGSLQMMLIFLNGWEGGGWQGGRLLSFSKPIESVVSGCVVFLTRASARLMGVCLGAFRGQSRRLFTKTYVSDYDRWGPGRGLGGQGDGGLWCLRAEEPLWCVFNWLSVWILQMGPWILCIFMGLHHLTWILSSISFILVEILKAYTFRCTNCHNRAVMLGIIGIMYLHIYCLHCLRTDN